MEAIYQGESRTINVLFQDDDLIPIDLTGATVVLYVNNNGNFIDRFKNPHTAGYQDITIATPASGNFVFQVTSAMTKKMFPGTMELALMITNGDIVKQENAIYTVLKSLTISE